MIMLLHSLLPMKYYIPNSQRIKHSISGYLIYITLQLKKKEDTFFRDLQNSDIKYIQNRWRIMRLLLFNQF